MVAPPSKRFTDQEGATFKMHAKCKSLKRQKLSRISGAGKSAQVRIGNARRLKVRYIVWENISRFPSTMQYCRFKKNRAIFVSKTFTFTIIGVRILHGLILYTHRDLREKKSRKGSRKMSNLRPLVHLRSAGLGQNGQGAVYLYVIVCNCM